MEQSKPEKTQEEIHMYSAIAAVVGGIFAEKQSSKLRGRKLPVKFKGPNGEEWAGRGRLPKWMQGQDKEKFRVKSEAA